MFERIFVVKYITSKNCFCYLSPNSLKQIQSSSVKLSYGNGKFAYFSVDAPTTSIEDQTIGVSSVYAKVLGIKRDEAVTLTKIDQVPTVRSLAVSPFNQDDYDVMEMLANNIQSTLLDQIRMVNNGQKVVIWIGRGLSVTVNVSEIQPVSPGRIDNLTEVVIKPPDKANFGQESDTKVEKFSFSSLFFSRIKNNQRTIKKAPLFESKFIARIAPFTQIELGALAQPFNVFLSKNYFSHKSDTLKNPQIYLLKLVTDPDASFVDKTICVRLFAFEDFLNEFPTTENLFLSKDLLSYFNCKIGSRVLLESYSKSLPEIEEIEISARKISPVDVEETFKQYLADNCKDQPFVLNANFILNIGNNVICGLKFRPEQQFCVVNSDFVRNVKLSVVDDAPPSVEKEKLAPAFNYPTTVANYGKIVDDSLFIYIENARIVGKFENVLITGRGGTGKTTLLKIIEEGLAAFPNFIFTKRVACKSIKGKTADSLHKLFTDIMFELVHHQPSVLVLDDLHVLCENVNEADGLPQNALYCNRISEMFEGLFRIFCERNTLGLLVTAEATSKLNKHIYGTRGHHLFKNVYSIENLCKKDRKELLKYLFSDHQLKNVDLEKLSEKTESFVVEDLVDFTNKALFESCQENQEQEAFEITFEHCERALETATVTSLHGINLNPPGSKDLSDIGGLSAVKTLLIETLLWPSKYPNLFADAPLRLPSGLLLYGPPGTGKTVLAGAAAKHCGLRLISIKGPELLSKYIGASEQAVRDVFQKAQSAKPCVLFFDEFDSLAPRRGHDNTGVTDRVVNQLLTQLDGVESLTGVFMLAATSRPDLLDPALLRPGRLDRHILCPLPDKDSRLEILQALSKSMRFTSDVNLTVIAERTKGFSGADLQSVLYSAQLTAVEELLEGEDKVNEEVETEVNQVQLEEALRQTRPSLTQKEKLKYQRINSKFENGSTDFQAGTRATLA